MTRKLCIYSTLIVVCSILLVFSCKKKENVLTLDVPEITSGAITDITQTSAIAGGIIVSEGGSKIVQRGICYDVTENPSINSTTIPSDSSTGLFSVTLTGLKPSTAYYLRAYAINGDGTGYGEIKKFVTSAIGVPTLSTDSISGITQTNALCTATIISDGGTPILFSGICFSADTMPVINKEGCTKTTSSISAGSFTHTLQGLIQNKNYYARAYATNSVGTSYGKQKQFKTSLTPTVPVLAATTTSSITQTTAMVAGNIIFDGGVAVTERGACYGTTANPDITGLKISNGTGTGNFTVTVTGLVQGTRYYVRTYAINSIGTSYGEQATFTTGVNTPTLSTTSASSVTYNTAISGGTISFNGGAVITACGICYGTTPTPTIAGLKVVGVLNNNSFSCTMPGLYASTKYYARAYATNSAGTSYGNEIEFTTTAAPVAPTLTTNAATSITQTSAVSGGNITISGGADVTERGICYATSSTPTTSNNKITNGSGSGNYPCTLSGLTPGTMYYVRAYATNSVGTAYGNEVTFTTSPAFVLPVLTTNAITNLTQTTATSGGNITSDGGTEVTERGICYGTSVNPTTLNAKIPAGTVGTGTFSINMASLSTGTMYYVRAYAINSVGTAYGNEVTFTTNPLTAPILSNTSVDSIGSANVYANSSITSDGGSTITARGFCYGTTALPTTANSVLTISGTSTGNFSGRIYALSPGSTYYVRSFATNSIGTSYGEQINFTTLALLPIVTIDVDVWSTTSISIEGNVLDDGGATVTQSGICWSHSSNPTISDNVIYKNTNSFYYVHALTNGIKYYFRGFAKNSIGITYSDPIIITGGKPPIF